MGTSLIHALLQSRVRREWANLSSFNALIKTPASWLSPVQLPAGAKIFVALGADAAADTVVYTCAGKSFYVKAGTKAGVVTPVSYHERKETLTAVYNASTLQLWIKTPLGKPKMIASK